VVRKQSRRETVGDDKHDSGGRTSQDGRPVAAAKDERYRERDRNVDERPLDLANRGRCADRPDRRESDPDGERDHERGERDPQPARHVDPIEDEEHRRRHEESECDPAPRL
jgi:hypothetical protein